MKILFVNLSNLHFTVATPETEPLGGSESALCYLARQLAQNGHDVSLVAHLPKNTASSCVMGVQHSPTVVLLNADFVNAEQFDVIVANNSPVAGPSLRSMAPKARILFWNHMAPNHLAVKELNQPVVRDSFDEFVYVSNWQKQVTEEIFNFKKQSTVIGNGFAPAFENLFASPVELLSTKQNRAAYTTTPFRGLNVLLDAMKGLSCGTKLDLYSSMKVYQTTADSQYEKLYAYAAENPDISQHGAVPQCELAERLKAVSFFTYPSTYAETFCITGLEAIAAGMKVLTTATAALPETLGFSADFVPVSLEDPPKLVADFRAMLEGNVSAFKADPTAFAEARFAALQHVNRTCTWKERAKIWEVTLIR